MHETTVYMCLYNATTAVQFQPKQQKCYLLQAIPVIIAIIILPVNNIKREILKLCE